MISVIFHDREIMEALQQLEHAAGDISPALKEIGEVLVESTKQRFVSKTGPDGEKWDDNTDVTMWAPKKNPGGGYSIKGRNDPLVDIGSLSEEIYAQISRNNTLEVGSIMEYAAMQQFGGTKSEFPHLWGDIPARPFLGVSESDADEILAIVHDHLVNP